MTDFSREAIDAALKRKAGADSAKAKAKAKAKAIYDANFATQNDLHTTCQHCHKMRRGTLAQLQQPCECENASTS